MKRLIIGCGYLGMRAAKAWLATGDDVWALTRSSERAAEFNSAGIQPIVGDVLVPETLASLNAFDEPYDTLLYAVARGRGSTVPMRQLYLDGLRNVLSRLSPMPRRMIYISSTSVYGQQNGEWVDETSLCEPVQDNGRICLDAEELFRSHVRSHDNSGGVVLRLAGIYGPGRLIARAAALKAGEPISANPEGWLNLIHVDDAVRALQAADRRGENGETYLVVDDEPTMRRNYYAALARLLDAPAPLFESPTVGNSDEKPGRGTTNKRCSNRKLREVLQVELGFPTIATGLPDALSQA